VVEVVSTAGKDQVKAWSWPFGTILATMSLLLLLPLFAFLAYGFQAEADRIRARAESAAMNLAQISAHSLERSLGDTQQFLSTLAGRASVRALDTSRCDPVFRDFQKSHPGFTALTTTTLDGLLVCSSLDASAARPVLKTSLAGGDRVGAPRFSVGRAQKGFMTGRWVLPVNQAVLDDTGTARGNIAAWLDLVRLSPLNESVLNRLPKDTVSTLFDDDGVVLARSRDAEKWVGVNRTGFPQATQALKQREGFFEVTSQTDSIERLYAVRPVEGTHWVISVGIPTLAMDAELARARIQGVALFCGALMFAATLFWLGRRYVVRPIQKGADVARTVQAGNLSARVQLADVGHIREFKGIAVRFNRMLDAMEVQHEKLARSEEELRTLFNEMLTGFALHDTICDDAGKMVDYRFVAVNRAFEEMTGLRAAEVLGKRVLEVLPDTESIWMERYGHVALTGESAAFESFSVALNKTYEVKAYRTRPGQFAVMTHDVSARIAAERELARERALLRRVIDTIPDLIFFKDATGRYMGCNKAFEAFAGRDEQAQVGKTDFDFFDHKTASFFREQDRRMMESGETRQNEEWVTYPDGRQVLLNTVKTPFGNAHGEAVGVLGISRDITAQFQTQSDLKARDETYRAMLSTAVDGFWIVDNHGQVIEVNEAYARMSGYTREELLGMAISKIDCIDSPSVVAARTQRIVANGSDVFESQHRRKNGAVWPVEVSANFWPEQGRHFVFIRDITQRKLAEAQLQQAAEVFENTQDGMMVTDLNDVIVRVNRAFTELTGYTEAEALGQKPSMLTSPQQDRSVFAAMRKDLAQKGRWKGEITNRRKSGEDFPQWMTISSVHDAAGKISHRVSTFTDISLLKEAQAKVHNLAFFDPLTQLPNRRLLLDRLHRAVASSARRKTCGAVLQIDLDHFKLLNETEGHEVGDQLLLDVARRLMGCVRDQDSLAHQGGDDFIVILEDLGHELHEAATRAEMVAEKILQSLREPYQLGSIGYNSQASVGIAIFHAQEDSAEEVLKRADTAMYRAKADGRNTVRFFDPAMQAALEHRIKLELELRQALPGNELQLYYQAQVDSVGRVVSAEALIRWVHPVRGLVSPVQFIPLAEESGLILPIGTWVLETACAQIKEWEKKESTRELQLAVNVSARQFRQTDFVAMTRGIIEQSGIDPRYLKLEMTESMVIDNVADTIEKMHKLKTLGLTFSMDDFGTGYSSLAYLKRLPLDQLKIDQSFVRDISNDPNDAAIVQTIITMGNTLGMNVIAEGVETQEQLNFLRLHGCATYQGYLFSRPVPLADFEQLLERQASLNLAP
jgi:diguanylate cyclase (GGDEF)-like protein/PAS domain S-box-containing protein